MKIASLTIEPHSTKSAHNITWPRWFSAVLILAVVSILVSGVWFYQAQKERLENAAKESLQSIIQLKINQIVRWRKERQSDAHFVRFTPYAARRAMDAMEQPDSQGTRSMFTGYLAPLMSSAPYSRALLLDSNLIVRLAYPDNRSTELCREALNKAQEVIQSRSEAVVDLHRENSGTGIHLDLLIPFVVRRERGRDNVPAAGLPPTSADRSAAVLLLEVNAHDYLFPLVQSWPTPSRTAETLLVRRESNSVLFLNELRHRKNTALNLQIPLTQTNSPAVRAVNLKEGIAWGQDYRGIQVLAAYKAIPNSPWFMVAKIDADEIYAGWRLQSGLILSLLFAVLAMVAAGVKIFDQKIQKRKFAQDIQERKLVEAELLMRARQQAAVALLGRYALDESNLESLMNRTVAIVADILEVECCKVLELASDGKSMNLLAGKGWKEGLVGSTVIDLGLDSQAGYTLRAKEPVVVEDLRTEKRFSGPALLRDHGVISGISIVIPGVNGPYGVLGAHSKKQRIFASDDVSFFQSVANLLGTAIQRTFLEAQLRQQQKLESIGTLASGVAHEINNPVNGIMNYAQLILDKAEAESRNEKFSREIIHESKRVTNIVRNLLQFARHEKQTHAPASINDILEKTLSLTSAVMRHDQIIIHVNLPATLPMARCHSQQIQQVLMNLLTNARDALNEKYHGKHEDKVVLITGESFQMHQQPWIRITVEDHGFGIPAEVSQRIFDPFFTTKSRDKGTGLGLSISHGIIKEHKGVLRFESEAGKHTRFHVELPVDQH